LSNEGAPTIYELARKALEEDRALTDVTTQLTDLLLTKKASKGPDHFVIHAKEDGIFSGHYWTEAVLRAANLELLSCAHEGQQLQKGTVVCAGRGDWRLILSAERTLLNVLQNLSGVATRTRSLVDLVERIWNQKGYPLAAIPGVYHTRKTLPLLRELQVAAVLAGGGQRHRMDLHERPLFKENHKYVLKNAGLSLGEWVREVVQSRPDSLIEVESPAEAFEAAGSGAKNLLLDNFSPAQVAETLAKLDKMTIEISGGLTAENIEGYLQPGVNRLSLGGLTHSVRALDMGLDWG
jgi:nicotinate-nucleotide pyrophosphorylase (carboxylating)